MIVQIVLLVIAISLDIFLGCMVCGTEKILINNKIALTISGVCSVVLLCALLTGRGLGEIVQKVDIKILGFLGFFFIGCYKLTEYFIKKYITKHKFLCKRLKISFSQLNFILSIYNNPVMADRDHSSVMSVSEAVFFSLAMSMDAIVVGLSAGLLELNIWLTTLCNFMVGVAAVKVGSILGWKAALKKNMDISWLGGVIFLILAFSKMFA